MKILVTGTRGIPGIPGGIEKHCEGLYPLIAQMGYNITIAVRKTYAKKTDSVWRNVKLDYLYAPKNKHLEAITHTFLAVLEAKRIKADIIHIHAVGPALMIPFAKILGLKVIFTNHGPDYNRQKWGKSSKFFLRLGEYLGATFADATIVISRVIQNIIRRKCHKNSHIIYNGVRLPEDCSNHDYIDKLNATPERYILAVSRFVPEKGLDLLVNAFSMLPAPQNLKLIIAGDADHETDYSRALKQRIDQHPHIIRTGYVTGTPLNQLFHHAGLFVLPSYHEGLPIALLEAMSYGLSVLVSDIPANLEVDLPEKHFFKCGDVDDLKTKMATLISKKITENEKTDIKNYIKGKYNWEKIAEQTVSVYHRAYEKKLS